MGNCLNHPSTLEYYTTDDDEWDYLAAAKEEDGDDFPAKQSSGGGGKKTTEVKIKITKKQLEALLGKVDVKDLRVEQVLAQLMSHSNRFQADQRPWRPALQSIPEVN